MTDKRIHIVAALCAACTLYTAARAQAVPDGERLSDHFQQRPLPELEAIYLQCSHESSQRLLGFDEAVACSFASEALLKRRFGGDFRALLAWWRANREATLAKADPR